MYVQSIGDTDSTYLCFNEVIDRLKEEGFKFNTEDEKREVYSHIENVYQNFFNKVLKFVLKSQTQPIRLSSIVKTYSPICSASQRNFILVL